MPDVDREQMTQSVICSSCSVAIPDERRVDPWLRCDECSLICTSCGRPALSLDAEDRGVACCSIQCEACGHYIPDGQQISITDGYACESCVFYCEDCGEAALSLDLFERCSNCSLVCSGCGEASPELYEGTCEVCYYGTDDDDEPLIRDYDYRPRPIFSRGMRPDGKREQHETFFGVEIEFEFHPHDSCGTTLRKIDAPDPWFFKHDGSLNYGAEAVSHPGTYLWWQSADLSWMDRARKLRCRSYNTETCGLHIHVSRSAVSSLTITKMLIFAEKWKDWILRVSRRQVHNFEQWSRPPQEGSQATKTKFRIADKYEAINIGHPHTIEFRFFRGTLDKIGFLRNLSIVALLINFARERSIQEMNPKDFVDWSKVEGFRIVGNKMVNAILNRKEFSDVSDNS